MEKLKNIILYSNIFLMILSCIEAGMTVLAIIITSGWSSDTTITFKANKFYIASIIIAVLCIILYYIIKNKHIIYGGNVVISVLFIIAEYFIRKNPYSTRTEWYIFVDILPMVFAMIGIFYKTNDNSNFIMMNIDEIKNICLHDFEIHDIICNYKEKKIEVKLKYLNQNINIIFSKAMLCSITLTEPWGEGFYIYDVELKNDGVVFLLNSGDEIYIVAETFSKVTNE